MKSRPSAKHSQSTEPTAKTGSDLRQSVPATTDGKYDEIRRDLQQQRRSILGEVIEGLAKSNGQEPFPDVSDQASAEAEQNFSIRIREREQRLVKKIDEALARMEQNTYGICERCEEEIPFPRLKARPVTTLCINCKTLEEQAENSRS